MTIEVQSLKIVNRYNRDVVLHDSKDYPEFSGDVWNDFILFLVNKKANLSGANLSEANLLNSARNKIKGVNCLEFNFNSCFTFLLVKNKKTAHLQIGCKKHTLDEWKLEFNVNNEYIDDCEDEANYNLHKDYFFKYLDLFESFLKEN